VVRERAKLQDQRKVLLRHGLYDHLKKVYDSLEVQAGRTLGLALKSGRRDVAEGLLEAEEQANLLEYESAWPSSAASATSPARRSRGCRRRRCARRPQDLLQVRRRVLDRRATDMRFLIQDRCAE